MFRRNPLLPALFVAFSLVAGGCSDTSRAPIAPGDDSGAPARGTWNGIAAAKGDAPGPAEVAARVREALTRLNARLAESGANYRARQMDLLGAPGAEEMGQTVYAFDRGNKQIGVRFVPGDPRRTWSPDPAAITYLADQSDGATANGLTNADTEPAIDRAMQTWGAVDCSRLSIVKAADTGVDPDLLDFLVDVPGALPGCCVADIVHAGWMNWTPLTGPGVLAFTVPFTWVDDDGNESDIDHDGNADYAFAEIYYNDGTYPWGIDTQTLPIDVETVVLHESGHGLGQGHFGAIFRTTANGRLHFAPLAVMNAAYTGARQELANTDIGGHCGLWARWPGQ